MESSVSTIVCPNCGANPQNHNNCEYCGSLLVRFADKNIPIVEEKYGSKAVKFDGLKAALTKNLEEQARTNGHNHIHTFIKSQGALSLEIDVTNPKAQTEQVLYKLSRNTTARIKPTYTPETDDQALVICIRFYVVTESYASKEDKESRIYQETAHDRFKQMDIYKLFSLQEDVFGDGYGIKLGKVYQYYLNFGRDIDGAAAIITQYLLHNSNASSINSLKVNYEQSSLSDKEYELMSQKALRGGKVWTSATFILGLFFIIPAIIMFIVFGINGWFADEDGTELILVLLGLLVMGGVVLWEAFRKNYVFKTKR